MHINPAVAQTLGLSVKEFHNNECLNILSGAPTVTPNSTLSMVYAGHQLGRDLAQLGGGRGLLLGQLQHPIRALTMFEQY